MTHETLQTEFTEVAGYLKEVADLIGCGLIRCMSGELAGEYQVQGMGCGAGVAAGCGAPHGCGPIRCMSGELAGKYQVQPRAGAGCVGRLSGGAAG
jgi:hypothetical protein